MAQVACPGCGKRYKVSASAAGKKVRCQACGAGFRLGSRKSAEPPREPRLDESWDDVFDDAYDGFDLADEPGQPSAASQPLRPMKPRSAVGSSSDLLRYAGVAVGLIYRMGLIALTVAPFLIGTGGEPDDDPDSLSDGGALWIVAICCAPLFLYLAYRGIDLSSSSMRTRFEGLMMIGGGVVMLAAGIALTAVTASVAEQTGFIVVWFGLAISGIFTALFGVFQVVSGHDLGS